MFKFKKKSKYYINIKNSLLTFKNPKNKKKYILYFKSLNHIFSNLSILLE